MLEAILSGLAAVISWPSVGYMLIAILYGLFIGFLPGIGGPVTVALLLPFVYGMEPATAVAFLLGAHAVGVTGGAVAAILFGVPGDGPNSATVLDGYPLATKGMAGRAIGASLTASALGGVFGALVLALLIPLIRPVVLAFGPSEFFMLALLGLAFLSTLSTREKIKGVMACLIGLLLSLIGEELLMGTKRFTFGSIYLWEGIKLVPAAIGLFAVAEMVDLIVKGGSVAKPGKLDLRVGPWEGIKDVFRNWGIWLRSSIIGVVIGIIPGLGGDLACFLAYGHAAQTSKNHEEFGKGAIQGVIAPQSAINAKEGGALVPTISFGIPGSSTMAVVLGALLIVGIIPGPELLGSQLDITFGMVWTLVIANIIGALIMFPLIRPLAALTFLDGSILAPVVLVIALLGAYSASNSVGDIVVALVMGLLGYEMKRLEFPRAALILGLVLGQIVEQNLFLTLRVYGSSFIFRPITLVLLIMVILVFIMPLIGKFIKRPDRLLPLNLEKD